jgi:SOS-response transcriptional repressor LexA
MDSMNDSPDQRFPDASRLPSAGLSSIAVRVEAPPASACDDGGVFALQVLGDSMLPEFESGDVIVVEPDGRMGDGSFVIARIGDEWALRQLRRGDGGWLLAALNGDVPACPIADFASVRGVVIQKSKPGRRRTIKRYD